MALDIPMPEQPGDAFSKGLSTGSDLIHKMMLNKYYGQLHPSGDVANAMYVEQLRQQFGEDDPRYVQAKAAHDLALQGHQSLLDYRNNLMQTSGIRATSPLGKEIAEGKGQGAIDILHNQKGVHQGTGNDTGYEYDTNGNNVVGTPNASNGTATPVTTTDNNPRTPEERAAYERKINKQTSDAQARNLLLRAENLDKTRNSIDPDDLTRYSGLKGTGNWLKDSAQSVAGNPSDQYIAHQKAVNSASLMVDQMRQFYGDSIQPTAMARLQKLANPATWYKDPKVAKAQWEQLNKILNTETETYRNHASSPITLNKIDFKDGQFTVGKNTKPATKTPANKSNVDKVVHDGGTTYHKINGQWVPYLGDQ
jgi:hypothetical protein